MPKTLMQRNENYAKHLPEMKEKDQGRKEKNGEKAPLTCFNIWLLSGYLGICPTHKHHRSHPLLRPALCGRSLTGSSILG